MAFRGADGRAAHGEREVSGIAGLFVFIESSCPARIERGENFAR